MAEIDFSDARKILGLSPRYSKEELKTQYRKLAKEHHPDHGGDATTFKRIQTAYVKLTSITMTDKAARDIEDVIFNDLYGEWKNGESY